MRNGEDYDVLEKCISINILDFKLFANKERFYFRFYNHDYVDCSMDIDDMEIHIIELPKLPEKLENPARAAWSWDLSAAGRKAWSVAGQREKQRAWSWAEPRGSASERSGERSKDLSISPKSSSLPA